MRAICRNNTGITQLLHWRSQKCYCHNKCITSVTVNYVVTGQVCLEEDQLKWLELQFIVCFFYAIWNMKSLLPPTISITISVNINRHRLLQGKCGEPQVWHNRRLKKKGTVDFPQVSSQGEKKYWRLKRTSVESLFHITFWIISNKNKIMSDLNSLATESTASWPLYIVSFFCYCIIKISYHG